MKAFIELGHRYHLPVIVDAAAEEDLKVYDNLGADAVVYSGTKAFEGPTSGFTDWEKRYLSNQEKTKSGIGPCHESRQREYFRA